MRQGTGKRVSASRGSSGDLGEDDEGGEAGGDVPDEAGVSSEPLDVALVAAVEEDGASGAGPRAGVCDEVALVEGREVGEAEVVQRLPEVAFLVLVRPRAVAGPREPLQQPRPPPLRPTTGEDEEEAKRDEDESGGEPPHSEEEEEEGTEDKNLSFMKAVT